MFQDHFQYHTWKIHFLLAKLLSVNSRYKYISISFRMLTGEWKSTEYLITIITLILRRCHLFVNIKEYSKAYIISTECLNKKIDKSLLQTIVLY